MTKAPIELKGSNFTLSVVYLNNPDPKVIFDALTEKMRQAPAFLLNAPIVLNISTLPLDTDFIAIKDAVTQAGLVVIGVSGCQNEEQKQKVIEAKLALLTEGKGKKTEIIPPAAPTPVITQSMVVTNPVRTGQQIYARNCDLIVTSHVSAGAEVIADGNIHVYGLLRGRALAGANNNDNAQIFCTQLAAELVSIAGQYWLSDQIPTEYYEKAAKLSIKNNLLTISYLK